ncbi:MAG: M28 family metallopeptidase [Pseudomonadota bacterium]
MNRTRASINKTVGILALVLLAWALGAAGLARAGSGAESGDGTAVGESRVLARVEIPGVLQDLDLPVYAHLIDGQGGSYALAIAPLETLQAGGFSFQVIAAHRAGNRYILAGAPLGRSRGSLDPGIPVLHDDGRTFIIGYETGRIEALIKQGFQASLLRQAPLVVMRPAAAGVAADEIETEFVADPVVKQMMDAVTEADLEKTIGELSGAREAVIGGEPYTFRTRYTRSGPPIEKATQYVFERFDALGLSPTYHYWTFDVFSGRNIIAELPGRDAPDEIILLTAHVDSITRDMISYQDDAPGADDNAGGCAAILAAAEIMRHHAFERTIRFAVFSGEELGLLGSAAYASSAAGEKIVAVINLDMIAYSTNANRAMALLTRTEADEGQALDRKIADLYLDVVAQYGLDGALAPTVFMHDSPSSDHYSFWTEGFPAILAVEDFVNDFNPYYHSKKDTIDKLNFSYCRAQTQALLGSAAHLADYKSANPTWTAPAGLSSKAAGCWISTAWGP